CVRLTFISFFFSSRRRHTRCLSDWSSDVCSSDLQAPQQFKQLLMVAGFDRYFQIAPCFRDEDARADRSPGEFYQLDVEMSFVTQDDVFAAIEPVMRGTFEEFADGKPVTPKFPLIPFATALRKYGTDKPDLRNPIDMQ